MQHNKHSKKVVYMIVICIIASCSHNQVNGNHIYGEPNPTMEWMKIPLTSPNPHLSILPIRAVLGWTDKRQKMV